MVSGIWLNSYRFMFIYKSIFVDLLWVVNNVCLLSASLTTQTKKHQASGTPQEVNQIDTTLNFGMWSLCPFIYNNDINVFAPAKSHRHCCTCSYNSKISRFARCSIFESTSFSYSHRRKSWRFHYNQPPEGRRRARGLDYMLKMWTSNKCISFCIFLITLRRIL